MEELKDYLIESFNAGDTASDCARQLNFSRQYIHQLIRFFEIDYRKYLRRWRKARHKPKKRNCELCNRRFIVNKNGATVKFCSKECKKEFDRAYRRVQMKVYLKVYRQTEKFKKYRKKVQKRKYERRNWAITRICPVCLQEFHPRLVNLKMKYCSHDCYYSRGKVDNSS